MPLARIITSSLDDSLELTMQLRSRGFLVETVGPDYVSDVPADVEVRLEECAPEDMLSKAALGKDSDDLWVFVAPGALDERARPMRTISLIPPSVAELASIPVLHTTDVPRLSPKTNIAATPPPPENELILSDLAMPLRQMPTELPKHNGNRVKSDKAVSSRNVLWPPVSTVLVPAAIQGVPSSMPAEPIAAHTVPRRKIPPVPKRAEISEIPKIPPRPETKFVAPISPVKAVRSRSYRIAFRGVPGLWRTASVALALVVLACVLTGIMMVRPMLSPQSQPAGVPAQPALVLPATPAPSPVKPTIETPNVPHRLAPPSTNPSVLQSNSSAETIAPQRPRRQRSGSDDGIIAEDTVIFYDGHGMKRPPHPSSRLNAKRDSDSN